MAASSGATESQLVTSQSSVHAGYAQGMRSYTYRQQRLLRSSTNPLPPSQPASRAAQSCPVRWKQQQLNKRRRIDENCDAARLRLYVVWDVYVCVCVIITVKSIDKLIVLGLVHRELQVAFDWFHWMENNITCSK